MKLLFTAEYFFEDNYQIEDSLVEQSVQV